ncbi:MAG: hypothetical protein A2X70_05910 [Alphaproteobacteria bacterium GWC2_42_16]|nr:MAG: hypothetical protein A2X70_05910 [Alphaproteobacteria bacterium GWC2_42_16]OFW73665.1 MAG: hypothetical protein A2Z80_02240 [Alphaproteobacteria bacterium GWA2_41_27]OFW81955.1 MAG: hypothetical protein A3E50_02055 [Alphaproteobacteria bacterium RIFCSPHIGHO2_12_FULL_42_100]OFW85991.1 MAG: hypothetical protein A2W06_00080 [Alphaproteobacteria bacterium RBG_16_42_14]OFW91091.1 MAG: hypothetical protein A3C41_05250 [Alphaproteobacteria bacterium RIFCSPHIGHO2_02_FULL_42_30]OFW93579.1 MAG: 
MTTNVITLEKVSKKYTLYQSHADRVREALHPLRKKYHQDHWALRDISIEIPKGETVGILGTNGSGKSTILQIICSILKPTSGQINVKGKIAALIELGAGFSPEMTGRQNAKINLTIMGLKKNDISKAIHDVEEFAELGEFFDQPVKTYSSGMFMRLAFATAITVDPDILIIDEALAVGDARFQQKCFQKFHEFQQAGKTILLVTHDRFSIPRLCTSAILMDKGTLIAHGEPKEIVDLYSERLFAENEKHILPMTSKQSAEVIEKSRAINSYQLSTAEDKCFLNPTYNKNEKRYRSGKAVILDYIIHDKDHKNPGAVISGSKIRICVSILFKEDVESPLVGYTVRSKEGIVVYSIHSGLLGHPLSSKRAGEIGIYSFEVELQLCTADWFIDLAVAGSTQSLLDNREGLIHLRVNAEVGAIGFANLKTQIAEEKAA